MPRTEEPARKKSKTPVVYVPCARRAAYENNRKLYELQAQVEKKHAPRVKEVTTQILESIKELIALNAEMKKESPMAGYGEFGHYETMFNGIKAKAEKNME
jgi:rubrerythrin